MGEKGKTITIHQPEHLPWLGFFNKMAKADVFVVLDNVPFRKNYFQNRNKILGTNGEQWIGVPVSIKGHIEGTIKQTVIAREANPKWAEKYLRTIQGSYGKYDHFDVIFPQLSQVIMREYEYLGEINFEILKLFADGFGIKTEFIKASDLPVEGRKSDLILDICKTLDAKCYIAGPFGREYLRKQEFDAADIEVCFNDYIHPTYPQKRTDAFVSHLSALDLVMNVGFQEGYRILMNGNETVSFDWFVV